MLTTSERFEACIIGGAIGDAWGSSYENEEKTATPTTYYLSSPQPKIRTWNITDDTQLTLASCEVLARDKDVDPAILAAHFVKYHQQKKLAGIGASTLKAIRELEVGGHWSQVGRSGEYAAGNGAAMRIAPFAFFDNVSRDDIRDICRITHKNDEAYAGALAVVLSIKAILKNNWRGDNNLSDIIIPQLPDTRLRDRLIEINETPGNPTIADIAKLGNNGYVVNSVPLAIFAASGILASGMTKMFQSIIDIGGDTDTNASIAGQVAGTLVGLENIPGELLIKLKLLKEYDSIKEIIERTKIKLIP